ncbi:MAG: hypothetical protein JOZ07_11635 [Solirubrobacterales bacterium]|nr:hypothetical protein [Solirubrobacterales bacterium]
MATAERHVILYGSPDNAVKTGAQALREAGFINIQTGVGTVSGQKRLLFEAPWRQVTLTVTAQDETSSVRILADADRPDLLGLASRSARRIADQVATALGG